MKRVRACRRGGRAAPAVLALALAACAPRQADERLRPLGGESRPQRLTESGEIALPPARHGNRFVSGWAPARRGGGGVVPQPLARLEWIRLAAGARRLELDLRGEIPPGGRVAVTVGGRELGELPLADPLRLAMPADLPEGKVTVELRFEPEAEERAWSVLAGALVPAAPAGAVDFEDGAWLQSGWSAVDFYVPPHEAAAVVTRFRPPRRPRAGQSFELRVESEAGARLGQFQWQPTLLDRVRGEREVRLPFASPEEFVRVRLLARGEGPPAAWRGLALAETAAPQPPPAAPAVAIRPPRVLLLYVLDALRADHVGYVSAAAPPTPTLDRLAREGMAFRDHWSVAPNTLPSTRALITGELPVAGQFRLPADGPPTLAERLRAAGYRTVLVNGNGYVGKAYGNARGFDETILVPPTGGAPGAVNDHSARAGAAALARLARLAPDERAFVYVHVLNPHNPYAPPATFLPAEPAARTIDGRTATLLALQHWRRRASADEVVRLRELYRGSVAYADAELGRFLAGLERIVPPGELVVATTADHGEELFDHGGVLHGYTLYDEQLRIPLVLWGPGRLEPRRVEVSTDTLDLHRTLLELGGAAVPAEARGESLLAVERTRRAGRNQIAVAGSLQGGIYAVRSPRLKLIWAPRTRSNWGMGEGLGRSRDAEYLFDRARDPGERVNLAGATSFEAELLRGVLDAWLERSRGAASGTDGETPLDAETAESLRALGYL